MIGQLLLWSGVIAVIRVGALWFLVSREWTHQPSVSALPLVLLLYPEGLLLPAGITWTATMAGAFTAVLIAGSAMWVTIARLAGQWVGSK
jgi:hypothetical protein